MKASFLALRLFKTWCLLCGGLILPLILTQCKSTGGNYKDVEYDPATLKTPSGHGMEKKEYPFDDDGRYRKEWVKNKSTGKTRSASKLPETEIASVDSLTEGAAGYYGPADAGEVTSNDAMVVSTVPSAPIASAPTAEYHKVVTGDTLYSLSQRYGTSVDEMKRMNGLSSDNIRTGQSLRVP